MEEKVFKFAKEFSLQTENFMELFSGTNFVTNQKHLLLLSLERIKLENGIFEELPYSDLIFTKETFAIALDENFKCEQFSKKDILNIFANQNEGLLKEILNLNIFHEISIIQTIEDYQKEALNIKQGRNIIYEILKNKSTKQTISIKYLLNEKGELDDLW